MLRGGYFSGQRSRCSQHQAAGFGYLQPGQIVCLPISRGSTSAWCGRGVCGHSWDTYSPGFLLVVAVAEASYTAPSCGNGTGRTTWCSPHHRGTRTVYRALVGHQRSWLSTRGYIQLGAPVSCRNMSPAHRRAVLDGPSYLGGGQTGESVPGSRDEPLSPAAPVFPPVRPRLG